MTTVWIYVDTNKEVGDVDHLKVFASEEAAEKWFAENDHPVPPKGGPTTQGYHLCRLAKRLKKHGLKETEAGITMKLKRGTFAATFFLACLAAMELEGVVLEEI
jgi:hypothetical protein